jgi:hypothetical protein
VATAASSPADKPAPAVSDSGPGHLEQAAALAPARALRSLEPSLLAVGQGDPARDRGTAMEREIDAAYKAAGQPRPRPM